MRWFRKPDRRLPENAEKRRLIDHLKLQRELGEKAAVQHKIAEAARKTDELSPRIESLRRQARVMRRT